ncbi:hypothetical protein PUN28_014986 [Cardiocondyla obscurior]|uniref:Uncharacterized protein n=1 Tax=Cardiocondyla obscurior TaxID=286306 RepID=A0AAW2EY51_9HYME
MRTKKSISGRYFFIDGANFYKNINSTRLIREQAWRKYNFPRRRNKRDCHWRNKTLTGTHTFMYINTSRRVILNDIRNLV